MELEATISSIQTATFVSEFRGRIESAINELEAANKRFGIGALTPEQIEKNLETIKRLEDQAVQLNMLNWM